MNVYDAVFIPKKVFYDLKTIEKRSLILNSLWLSIKCTWQCCF